MIYRSRINSEVQIHLYILYTSLNSQLILREMTVERGCWSLRPTSAKKHEFPVRMLPRTRKELRIRRVCDVSLWKQTLGKFSFASGVM